MLYWTKTNTFLTKISDSGSDKFPLTYGVGNKTNETIVTGVLNNSIDSFNSLGLLLKTNSKFVKLVGNNILNRNLITTQTVVLYNSALGSYAPFTKTFIIRGIGYQVDIVENCLTGVETKEFSYNRYLSLRVGHSYHLYIPIPDCIGVKVSHKDRKLVMYSSSKEQVADFAKKIWKLRAPSVYTGRGIRIKKSMHRRKLGKKDIRKGKV